MTEWLGNCQEKFYHFAGCIVKNMGQREIQRVADRWQRAEDRGQTTDDRNFPVGAAFPVLSLSKGSRDSNDFYDFNNLTI